MRDCLTRRLGVPKRLRRRDRTTKSCPKTKYQTPILMVSQNFRHVFGKRRKTVIESYDESKNGYKKELTDLRCIPICLILLIVALSL